MKTWVYWSGVGVLSLAVISAAGWKLLLHPEAAVLPVASGFGPSCQVVRRHWRNQGFRRPVS
ncbi:hypothetical protein NBRC3280_1359 [Acetobacter pasteurianus NBRC 3280]|uniref:Uncharacterized protein n=1 Tax=Acetobacter pasteurianus NBRC 3278 TaxID=1226660 RepID=A0A401X3F8_ACEPA|nr:hypothetical protein NBRC3277_1434 [Acetobacter pasteurianus NBRC 3277]GCD62351.1 hypothetical protein NBRC3278_1444 [Acetobacter pasteurianus NBRC 3278]GCD68724.1 hypothetical protein NBRC3280_1359 [Acetobacter pasteurianus NBRC 3280]